MSSSPAASALQIHEQDNVAVMTAGGQKGQPCLVQHLGRSQTVVLRADVPFGHKIAVLAIPQGAPVLKYGTPIGVASADIAAGDHVHVHNVVGLKRHLRG